MSFRKTTSKQSKIIEEEIQSNSEEEEILEDNEIGNTEEMEKKDQEEEEEEGEEIESEEKDNEFNQEEDINNKLEEENIFEGENAVENIDVGEINLRIEKILEILSDFATKKEEGKTRNSYITELKKLIIKYYEYNEDICNLIFNMFPPNEAVAFIEANNKQRIVTIRINTLKTTRREGGKCLMQRGVNLEPLSEWSKVGLKIFDSQVPIGATPEYLAGQYMLQSASSFLPVLALDPQPKEKILDMCAAPGGKTTYIAQLMKNTGILVANELKSERLKSLFFNIHRLGIKNTVITNYDGRQIPKLYPSFDRVLLDAPCSGLGVISKDQSIKLNRTYKEILNNSRIQKELLLAAIDSCNVKGSSEGIIVYSTCSIAVEENEWVVDYALKQRYVKCIELGFVSDVGTPGFTTYREKHFHPNLKNTRRIYPHVDNMDGFFVAKLKKYADGNKLQKSEVVLKKNRKKTQKNKDTNDEKEEEEIKNNNLEEEVDLEEDIKEVDDQNSVGKERQHKKKKKAEVVDEDTDIKKTKQQNKKKDKTTVLDTPKKFLNKKRKNA